MAIFEVPGIKGFLLSACLILTGCTTVQSPNSVDPTVPVALSPGEALVILDVTIANPLKIPGPGFPEPIAGAFISIDPSTGARLPGTPLTSWAIPGGLGAPDHRSFFYRLPAGTYSLTYVYCKGDHLLGNFAWIRTRPNPQPGGASVLIPNREFSDAASAETIAPTFTVKGGDVTYVGNLILDFGDASKMSWSVAAHEDGARKLIAATNLADRLMYHPLTRRDRSPIQLSDSVPITPTRPPMAQAETNGCSQLTQAMTACALTDQEEVTPLRSVNASDLKPGKSVVIVGISLRNLPTTGLAKLDVPAWIDWISYDPLTGMRDSKISLYSEERCDGLMSQSVACKSVQMRAFVVAPGNYSLGWILAAGNVHKVADFTKMTVEFGPGMRPKSYSMSDDAKIAANAPTFSVQPNEVVYVGDIVLDMSSGSMAWSRSDDAAKAFLTHDGLSANLAVRPGGFYTGGAAR